MFWDESGDYAVRVSHMRADGENDPAFFFKHPDRRVCVREVIQQAEKWLEEQEER